MPRPLKLTPEIAARILDKGLVERTARAGQPGQSEAALAEVSLSQVQDRTIRLFVNNLPWSMTSQELAELFRAYGTVFWGRVLLRDDGRSRGCGFVQMRSAIQAHEAIAGLNGRTVKGRKVSVAVAKSRNG